MNQMEKWLELIIELQSIAQGGIAYANNPYDIEKYTSIREIASEMISYKTGISKETVESLFMTEEGYQTPKIDTRAAVFKDNKILMVKENNGTWSLPGGWCDVLETIKSNTIKEVKEEAGLEVAFERVIAIEERNKRNPPVLAYCIIKFFSICSLVSGEFIQNIETIESGFFALDELPSPLAVRKNTYEQIKMCFDAFQNENWEIVVD